MLLDLHSNHVGDYLETEDVAVLTAFWVQLFHHIFQGFRDVIEHKVMLTISLAFRFAAVATL